MRKDKGFNGDLDRLPLLTWIIFLRFLDDLELQHEGEPSLNLPDQTKSNQIKPVECANDRPQT